MKEKNTLTKGHNLENILYLGKEKEEFLKGAEIAYEDILTSFAKGESNKLKALLTTDMASSFEEAIKVRKKNNIKTIKKLPKIKGIKEIMYPGQKKYKRFVMGSKKEIIISEVIKRDLELLKK